MTDELVKKAEATLLEHLPKQLILARYLEAPGQELAGKFNSPRSSAALVANTFGLFVDKPHLLTLPVPPLPAGAARQVILEARMRFPWGGGEHPCLDVAVEAADDIIAIESKRYEPFCDSKSVEFSQAYWRPVWGPAMAPYEAMRDALHGGRVFRFLDAAQLVKHAFGPRTEAQRKGVRATLCYVYAEPKALPDGSPLSPADVFAHRQELNAFTREVAAPVSEVHFCSYSYTELMAHWVSHPDLRDHVSALIARFPTELAS